MKRTLLSLAIAAGLVVVAAPARAAVPSWARPAVRYLDEQGYWQRDALRPNQALKRRTFARIMRRTFGGGYQRTIGKVTAGEVSAALVRVLGKKAVADALHQARSPDGWDPKVGPRFGSEIVARELGLRHDRPTADESLEASAHEPMRQADIAYALWKAKIAPSLYAADALHRFGLSNYDSARRQVVRFALSLVGTPYVWGGEWPHRTPDGYPYGIQTHGGFDCSGFAWYVLRERSASWAPIDRPYRGWSLPERTSSDMARAASRRLPYDKLRPGDLAFFSPDGRDAKARTIYHAGIYLGRGWMVHSSGSRAGISLAEIGPGSWWHAQLSWGRRVISG